MIFSILVLHIQIVQCKTNFSVEVGSLRMHNVTCSCIATKDIQQQGFKILDARLKASANFLGQVQIH